MLKNALIGLGSVALALVARSQAASCPTTTFIPDFRDDKLPDPFLFNDGRPVTTAEEWECRRAEIAALIQGYEAGFIPPKPAQLSGNFTRSSNTSGTLAVTAGDGTNSISWSQSITFPNGSAPAAGWPLVIGYDGGSIPVPDGIAILSFPTATIAQQNDNSSRGIGLFYELYGQNATASAMSAWVWAVSRIIDVLEETPSADINIKKLAVTGCSRDGKGALMAGAFEKRIALTIPQESGSGGDACWRLSLFEQDEGSVVQTATEIVQENVWFSDNFANFVNNLSVLPFDHHMLMAMVAPRGLVSYENTDFVWLSPVSNFGCVSAARPVFEALGVKDHHGFEQIGGHAHCAWPANLTDSLDAFFNKFIFDEDVDTDFFATNDVFNGVEWNASQWINWTTPTLV